MAFGTSNIGLLFKIKAQAETKEATAEVKKLSSDVKKEMSEIDKTDLSGANSGVSSLTDNLSAMIPVAGGVVAGIGAIVGIAATAGAALFSLARSTAESAKEIENFNKLTGFSTDTVQALGIAAKKTGSSLEEIEEVYESFVELMIEGGQGAEDAKKKLISLGLDPQKAYQDLEGSFLKVLDKIRETDGQAGKAKIAMDGMGESGLNMVKVADAMTGGTEKYIQTLKEQGRIMDADGIRRSKEFSSSLTELESATASAGREFALVFMPEITSALKEVSKFVKENKEGIQVLGLTVAEVVNNSIYLFKLLKDAAKSSFGGMALDILQTKDAVGILLAAISPLLGIIKTIRQFNGEKTPSSGITSIADLKQKEDTDTKTRNTTFNNSEAKKASDKKTKAADDPTKNWTLTKVLEAMRKGTMSQESGGNPNARNQRTNASGLFQVMPNNIKNWTRETFGREMSVAEFKKDTNAQIAIFNKYMGSYLQKGLQMAKGNWDTAIRIAAVQWYGTSKKKGLGFDDPTIFQKGEPSRQTYTKSVLQKTRKFLTGKDSDFEENQVEKQNQIAEKLRTDAIKSRESQDAEILRIAKNTANEEKAISAQDLENKLFSKEQYRKAVEASEMGVLETEKAILTERLKMVELNAEDQAKIQTRINDLNSEIRVKQIESETEQIKDQNEQTEKSIKDQNEGLEKQRKILEEIASIREKVIASQREKLEFDSEQERKILENDLENAKTKDAKMAAKKVLEQADIEFQKRRYEWILEDIEREKNATFSKLTNKEIELGKKEKLEELYENQRLLAKDAFEARKKEIEDRYKQPPELAGSEKLLGGLLNQGELDVMKALGQELSNTMNTIADATGNAVVAFIKFGSVGGSFRKFAAEMIASIAKMAVVQAIWNTAEGFAKLALAFFGHPTAGASATQHFVAAGMYAGIAGVATIAGRAIAGDSFKQANQSQATANSRLTTAQNQSASETQAITEGRIQRSEQTRIIELKVPAGFVERNVIDNFNSMGTIRQAVIKIVEQN